MAILTGNFTIAGNKKDAIFLWAFFLPVNAILLPISLCVLREIKFVLFD